jgi:hypothetical protein
MVRPLADSSIGKVSWGIWLADYQASRRYQEILVQRKDNGLSHNSAGRGGITPVSSVIKHDQLDARLPIDHAEVMAAASSPGCSVRSLSR